MEINIEIKVNQELKNVFIDHLRNAAAGMGTQDQREAETLIDHCEHTAAESWSQEAKQELALFLMFRAGFQAGCGYCAEMFQA